MGPVELFLAALLTGISLVNLAVPAAAWQRTRDPRFLMIIGANTALLITGIVWSWGQLPLGAPAYASVQLPVLALVLLAALFLLASSLWPRRA
jgi:predicted lysophospholipase L1 biosynthesis ABC-type transport system permease subunit